jgi:ABC-type spermidine/putrescine transport system permease subunit II
MEIVTFAIAILAALFAICSGVWVATALVSAISKPRTAQTAQGQADEKK